MGQQASNKMEDVSGANNKFTADLHKLSEAVIEANNKFTIDLHKALRDDETFVGKNLFYSPSSLSIALAMTYMGARNNTAAQMSKTLHWDGMPAEQLHTEEKHFLEVLQASNSASNELLAANRLFLQKNFRLVQEFVEETKTFYGAEIALVDYKKDAEGARKVVNQWVEEKTKQMITDLIDGFDKDTRLTLVNAIYFKGFWQTKFEKKSTRTEHFLVSGREKVEVQMMHVTNCFKHVEQAGELACQVLELPYQGEDLSMVILLPHDTHGLGKLEQDLTHDNLKKALQLVSQSYPQQVEVSLPRFKLSQQFSLGKILVNTGATDMFNEYEADFSGMSPVRPDQRLYVSGITHKAIVEVNEEGTKAAAATAVGCGRSRGGERVRVRVTVFRADHPFLFMICHKKSSAILFMGRVVKPESD